MFFSMSLKSLNISRETPSISLHYLNISLIGIFGIDPFGFYYFIIFKLEVLSNSAWSHIQHGVVTGSFLKGA